MSERIDLQSFIDDEGSLVIGEAGRHIPFPIKRFFAITNVSTGDQRGGHAHKELNQVLVCLSGLVQVTLNDGQRSWKETLEQPGIALHIKPMIWAEQVYADSKTVLLVLCDEVYRESDYLRDFDEFCRAATNSGEKK
ncbi:MAG: FdtA/QdtA family cupin domain-containing protein [Rhodospirillaceae bacterium]|jgi:hypothetical protein|nr:FdtA/QdtA family cupin domain-containing protein [Rhodospirillaceae bacterium]MBT5242876.1 FdtA/QdtA family cupin domain-containing protein [Rhodospirillaceae bacterium]MBT5563100.1 FdtA/QdtA family cupin domain-containing protein [Rhodospirillaceae bacterium]MBT6243415.1 FdtA/QdtA family cupin domain-containing protein [Rhodospirillaceae bacterium]MBT7138514.1 FdtA/QdtA family cupin domain-containing protein [Rhodospirillaceae bacterium]